MKRTTKTTQGKSVTFEIDEYYITDESSAERKHEIVFDGVFANMPYCVAYTKVKHDKGANMGMLYGTPAMIPYDNGLVGYQCFDFYLEESEAKAMFASCSNLGDKYDGTVYCDVMVIKNIKYHGSKKYDC
jgi:hypothetical protein